jgi:uncharacterized protein YbcI
MGHQPGKITCELGERNLTIVIEDSLTQPEQILAQQGQQDLVKEVRNNLDDAFKPELRKTIEETIGVEVEDILSDAAIESGRTGIVAILQAQPKFREPTPPAKSRS